MPISNVDLRLYQGSDFAARVTITLDENLPADLTGYRAEAEIRRAVADNDPVVAAEMMTTIQSPSVLLALTNDKTQLLHGRYVWDLRMIGPADEVVTVMAGKVDVTPEVTRI